MKVSDNGLITIIDEEEFSAIDCMLMKYVKDTENSILFLKENM